MKIMKQSDGTITVSADLEELLMKHNLEGVFSVVTNSTFKSIHSSLDLAFLSCVFPRGRVVEDKSDQPDIGSRRLPKVMENKRESNVNTNALIKLGSFVRDALRRNPQLADLLADTAADLGAMNAPVSMGGMMFGPNNITVVDPVVAYLLVAPMRAMVGVRQDVSFGTDPVSILFNLMRESGTQLEQEQWEWRVKLNSTLGAHGVLQFLPGSDEWMSLRNDDINPVRGFESVLWSIGSCGLIIDRLLEKTLGLNISEVKDVEARYAHRFTTVADLTKTQLRACKYATFYATENQLFKKSEAVTISMPFEQPGDPPLYKNAQIVLNQLVKTYGGITDAFNVDDTVVALVLGKGVRLDSLKEQINKSFVDTMLLKNGYFDENRKMIVEYVATNWPTAESWTSHLRDTASFGAISTGTALNQYMADAMINKNRNIYELLLNIEQSSFLMAIQNVCNSKKDMAPRESYRVESIGMTFTATYR